MLKKKKKKLMQHYGREFKCTIVRIFKVMVPTATAIQLYLHCSFIYVLFLKGKLIYFFSTTWDNIYTSGNISL